MNELAFLNLDVRKDSEGLYCINDLHKASGGDYRNQPSNWMRNQRTQELIALLMAEVSDAHIRGVAQKQIVRVRNGGSNVGTFVCEELVYSYAMWISATFTIRVIRAYDAMVNSQQSQVYSSKPYSEVLREFAEEIERKERLELETKQLAHIGYQPRL